MFYTKHKKKISRASVNGFNLKLGCDCVVAFVIEAIIEKIKKGRPSKSKALTSKTWYLGKVHKMRRKIANKWVKYREPIDLLDRPSHMEIGLCWYQNDHGSLWTYDLTNHIMVDLETIIALTTITFVVDLFCFFFSF